MLINSPNISGSLTVTGNATITGSLTVTGGINATITGSATSASYVEYTDVANKPTLVSGSEQVSFNGITDKPTLVSSSAQIVEYGIFATTGSNQFDGNQAITGSLTVTGQVVAQTLNVQQVTSSIVFSSGSNIFGNSLSNTQQFTGSVSVTGSLAVNGTSAVTGTGTSGQVAYFNGTTTIASESNLFWDASNDRLGIRNASPSRNLDVSGSGRFTSDLTVANSSRLFLNGSTGQDWALRTNSSTANFEIVDWGTEVARIIMTPSGNLGLGVTPSAWNTSFKAIQVGVGASFWASNISTLPYAYMSSNQLYDAGNASRYIMNGFATWYIQEEGSHKWLNAPNNTSGAGAAISFTQAMTLGSNSGLSIGTTSAAPSQGLLVQGDFIFNGLGQGLNTTNKSTASLILGENSLLGRVSFKNVPGTGFINNVYEPLIYSLHSGTVAGSGSSSLVIQAGSTGGDRHLYFRTADTTRLFIENNGNVGIGTASPFTATNQTRLTVNGTQVGGVNLYVNNVNTAFYAASTAGLFVGSVTDIPVIFSTNDTERMRITSGGFSKHSNNGVYGNAQTNSTFHEFHRNNNGVGLNVFCETSSYTSSVLVLNCTRVTSNGTYSFIEAAHQNVAVVFRVADSGNVTNVNNSYGSISDIKLKENIQDASPKLQDLLKVKVRNYNLIGEDTKQIGVIAQELEEVFPAMIDESEDFEELEVPQLDEEGNEVLNEEGEVVTTKERVSKGTTTKSVKYSVFVPMLIKAIQEQQAQIESLKAEIQTLKQ